MKIVSNEESEDLKSGNGRIRYLIDQMETGGKDPESWCSFYEKHIFVGSDIEGKDITVRDDGEKL